VSDDEDVLTSISRRYERFADTEARGRSPLYEQCARATAADPTMLAFLATLPEPKRQPNLLFAAAHWLAGVPDSYAALRAVVLERSAALPSSCSPDAPRPTNPPGAPPCCRSSRRSRNPWRCSRSAPAPG
jgi:hypothetical protein